MFSTSDVVSQNLSHEKSSNYHCMTHVKCHPIHLDRHKTREECTPTLRL